MTVFLIAIRTSKNIRRLNLYLNGFFNQLLHTSEIPGVDSNGRSLATCLSNLPLHSADSRLGRIGVRWKRGQAESITDGFCCNDHYILSEIVRNNLKDSMVRSMSVYLRNDSLLGRELPVYQFLLTRQQRAQPAFADSS